VNNQQLIAINNLRRDVVDAFVDEPPYLRPLWIRVLQDLTSGDHELYNILAFTIHQSCSGPPTKPPLRPLRQTILR